MIIVNYELQPYDGFDPTRFPNIDDSEFMALFDTQPTLTITKGSDIYVRPFSDGWDAQVQTDREKYILSFLEEHPDAFIYLEPGYDYKPTVIS